MRRRAGQRRGPGPPPNIDAPRLALPARVPLHGHPPRPPLPRLPGRRRRRSRRGVVGPSLRLHVIQVRLRLLLLLRLSGVGACATLLRQAASRACGPHAQRRQTRPPRPGRKRPKPPPRRAARLQLDRGGDGGGRRPHPKELRHKASLPPAAGGALLLRRRGAGLVDRVLLLLGEHRQLPVLPAGPRGRAGRGGCRSRAARRAKGKGRRPGWREGGRREQRGPCAPLKELSVLPGERLPPLCPLALRPRRRRLRPAPGPCRKPAPRLGGRGGG